MQGSRYYLQRNGIAIVSFISLKIGPHLSAYKAFVVYRCRSVKGFETGIAFLIVRVVFVINENWL